MIELNDIKSIKMFLGNKYKYLGLDVILCLINGEKVIGRICDIRTDIMGHGKEEVIFFHDYRYGKFEKECPLKEYETKDVSKIIIPETNKFVGKIYLASGWFSPAQRSALDKLEKYLMKAPFGVTDVYAPRLCNDMNKVGGARSTEQRMECFKNDIQEIDSCDFLVVSGVEFDSGTIFEMGYAYAKGKPIIYYNDNPEDHKRMRNLMLVGATENYYAKNIWDLEYILKTGLPTSYGDDSEEKLGRLGEDK